MQTFRQFIESYDTETLRDMAQYGCAGGIGGLIYYTETSALYDQHAAELHEIVAQIVDETGEFPKYLIENFGTDYLFKNAMVWLCAELIAQEIETAQEV